MRSFSVRPARLILVPSALQSHALLPFRPTSSPSAPPVTRPCAFPSHIILVNPSSHMPFYLFISFNISSQLCVFSPLVLDLRGKCRVFRRKRFTFPRGRQGHRLHRPLSPHLQSLPPGKVPGISAKTVHFPPVADRDTGSTCLSRGTCHFHPWGKCRVFLRKWFTFPRGRQGRWLHRPLWPHLAFPPLGKVPGISAKTVHFPPWLAGAPAPQASLAAPAISTSGESAGFFGENGSLSPVACRGTGSTGLSRGTCHFHPRGKCREFPRKRFTFPRGRPGYRLHRPLSRHLPFLPLGKVPSIQAL